MKPLNPFAKNNLLLGVLFIGILVTACRSKDTYHVPPLPPTSSDTTMNTAIRYPSIYDRYEMPSFPEGEAAMMKFVSENFRYPANDSTNAQGRINLQFTVLSTGKIDSIKVLRSVTPDIDKEAIRVVESMPLWIPGKKDGELTDIRCQLPINIRRE